MNHQDRVNRMEQMVVTACCMDNRALADISAGIEQTNRMTLLYNN